MNRIRRISLGVLCAVGLSAGTAGSSEAGSFTMKQCLGAKQLDFQAAYSSINASRKFDAVSGCVSGGLGKLGVYQDRSGGVLTFGAGGQFKWVTPPGARVIGTRITTRLKDVNGITAELIGYDGGSNMDIDGGISHDGEKRQANWSGRPQTIVAARLSCDSVSGCQNGVNSPKAFLEVTDTEFTVQDLSAPAVTPSGQLWNWGADWTFHRGLASIRVDASDQGSGVAATWIEVNGLRVDLAAPACPGDRGGYATRFAPCPSTHTATRSFDTASAPFQEGANSIRVCARDYADAEGAANLTCSVKRNVLVDNQPPGPPVNLRSEEGTGWRPENGFNLRWEEPAGQVAPLHVAFYFLYDQETGERTDSGLFDPSDGVDAGSLEVPGPGTYRVAVRLADWAANLGEPAETILRFDDRPPGDVSPEPSPGWVSRDELPLRQVIEQAEPGGPSGISGYALSTSREGPELPCGSPVCLAPEITLAGGAGLRTGSIGGLGEGSHWVSAVAVSGASRSSLEPGSTVVQVDRTPPRVEIEGIPNGWVNHPVALTVTATDRLSGMRPDPRDEGEPKTVIEAEDYAPYESPGSVASFAVATEGVNRISYWAQDLAGNANDGKPGPDGDIHASPGQAVVRIDTTPPTAVFDPTKDPQDPELVRVSVEDDDSGVAAAKIGIRPAGSDQGFATLTTERQGGFYEARIPSDDLARGAYELQAVVRDRAGNEANGDETSSGQPMIRNLPLKRAVSLTAVLANGRSSLRAKYGSRPRVEGRLTSSRAALPNQPLQVLETFPAGSRKRVATRTVRTDGDGRYRVRLGKGPSRRVEVRFRGTRRLARTASPRLDLNVKGRVRFRTRPNRVYNGGAVRMKGSVGFKGALPPARGKLVAIQYLDPSRGKWRPVEVLRTDRKGRFHYTYRFRTISSAQRIVFRANLMPEAGWPYQFSTSKPRSVIVYPKEKSGR